MNTANKVSRYLGIAIMPLPVDCYAYKKGDRYVIEHYTDRGSDIIENMDRLSFPSIQEARIEIEIGDLSRLENLPID